MSVRILQDDHFRTVAIAAVRVSSRHDLDREGLDQVTRIANMFSQANAEAHNANYPGYDSHVARVCTVDAADVARLSFDPPMTLKLAWWIGYNTCTSTPNGGEAAETIALVYNRVIAQIEDTDRTYGQDFRSY